MADGTTTGSDESKSDENRDGACDSSKAQQSDDSNSNDNGGNTDSSHGASVSNRSQATSDGPGDRSRG